jgi:hypothetical protein
MLFVLAFALAHSEILLQRQDGAVWRELEMVRQAQESGEPLTGGFPSYYMKMDIGTPGKTFNLILDTGSSVMVGLAFPKTLGNR